MGEVHVYRRPGFTPHTLKSGVVRHYANTVVETYVCRLFHPDAAFMARVHAAVEAGMTRRAAAAFFGIRTVERLRRLMRRFPPPPLPALLLPALPATLSEPADEESLAALLASMGLL